MIRIATLGFLAITNARPCPAPLPPCKDPRPADNRNPLVQHPCLLDQAVRKSHEEKARAGEQGYDVRLWEHYESLKQPDETMQWLTLAAGRGHPHSQYTLGFTLLSQAENAGARAEAVSWMEKAAEKHATFAGFLGSFYWETLHDRSSALKWSQHGATLGDASALEYTVKLLSETGEVQQACLWYHAAREATLVEEADTALEARCGKRTAIDDTLVQSLREGVRRRDDVRAEIARCFPDN